MQVGRVLTATARASANTRGDITVIRFSFQRVGLLSLLLKSMRATK